MIHRWRVFAGCPISQEAIRHGVALPRRGFSLLEMIIAIAILASSAMVLSSLIGLGAKYGNKAEERTHSLLQSQAMLDEWIARLPQLENQSEVTGELPSFPPRSYRIKVEPFQVGGNEERPSTEVASTEGQQVSQQGALVLVTMELFEPGQGGQGPAEGKPLQTWKRLVRKPASMASGQEAAAGLGSAPAQTSSRSISPREAVRSPNRRAQGAGL